MEKPEPRGPGFGNYITCPVTSRLSRVRNGKSTLPMGTPCP